MKQYDLFTRRARTVRSDPREIAIHGSIIDVLTRWASPGWLFSHFPSGEARDAKTGAKLKRLGTKKGWPDLILFSPQRSNGAFFLEVKRRTGRLTEEQKAFRDWAQSHGYPYAVVHDVDQGMAVLTAWGAIRAGIRGFQ